MLVTKILRIAITLICLSGTASILSSCLDNHKSETHGYGGAGGGGGHGGGVGGGSGR